MTTPSRYVANVKILLVLDNFEHLLPAGKFLRRLLPAQPHRSRGPRRTDHVLVQTAGLADFQQIKTYVQFVPLAGD